MKTIAATFRNVLCFLSLLALSVVLAACGGGGGGTSSNPSGSASVNVSVASAPAFPAGTSFTASPAAVEVAANPVSPGFDNVWVKIEKVALLPAKEGEGPDPNGEVIATDDGPGHDGAVVSGPIEQKINLLDLPSGQKIAKFLNKLDVPAGTYGKIRVYYSELWGQKEGDPERIDFHPTANSHFDVHFVSRDLVIPVAPDGERGIHLYNVTISFVGGLKIVENKNKVLMRPQVFATLVEAVEYVISGIADNVDKRLGTFDVSTGGGRSFHTMFSFDNNITKWAFKDNETMQQVAVDNNLGIPALRDGSLLDVYGMFTGIDTLFADNVVITFIDAISGSVAEGGSSPSVWQNRDGYDFFELNPSSSSEDNVVIPRPDRTLAYYDNAASDEPLTEAAIDNNVSVKARGYIDSGVGIDAFWISIGP